MSSKSLGNPFDGDISLSHKKDCGCETCNAAHKGVDLTSEKQSRMLFEKQAHNSIQIDPSQLNTKQPAFGSSDDMMGQVIENAIVRGVFGQSELGRRNFMKMVGSSTAAAVIGSMLPIEKAKAAVMDTLGKLEKTKLNIGFVPITCATPIIMAKPMGFYEKYGLDVNVIKTAGWAVARDKSLAGEYDAAHMLTPMPLAMTMGAGSSPEPYIMPAIENINGQAIVLHVKHKDKRDPKQWKGFKFGVPFEYSMHNFLLRYYVAEFGLDPDVDIQIRVVPPPEMVANLRAGNLDGYLSPDPFNQRAVWEKVGFLHTLTKDIWAGHPCCAFACSQRFASENPNTYTALLRSIVDATHYSQKHENRKEIAEAISIKNYLNQPVPVVQQVLTGYYADGLGGVQNVPDRIDFDPFPWHSMAVWILTQMKRWGYISGDVNYQQIAEQVYLAADAKKTMQHLGYSVPTKTYKNHTIMDKVFDPAAPEAYLQSFAIKK